MRFVPFADEKAEAAAVVDEIAGLIRDGGVAANEIAILVRTNEQPRLFEAELRRLGVRYMVIGSQSFYDRREIRDLLAYLKVLARPHGRTVAVADHQHAAARNRRRDRRQADDTGSRPVERVGCRPRSTGRRRNSPEPWPVSRNCRISSLASVGEFDEGHAPSRSCSIACWKSYYQSEIERLHDEPEQQLARMGALEQLREAIKTYADRAESPSLAGFLDDSALLGPRRRAGRGRDGRSQRGQADDAAQRQGARVSPRLSRRTRRGPLAAQAGRSRTTKTRSPKSVGLPTSESRGR